MGGRLVVRWVRRSSRSSGPGRRRLQAGAAGTRRTSVERFPQDAELMAYIGARVEHLRIGGATLTTISSSDRTSYDIVRQQALRNHRPYASSRSRRAVPAPSPKPAAGRSRASQAPRVVPTVSRPVSDARVLQPDRFAPILPAWPPAAISRAPSPCAARRGEAYWSAGARRVATAVASAAGASITSTRIRAARSPAPSRPALASSADHTPGLDG